jgi:phosphopantothenoylcysteine decarboxylase/phosphopantothenate--cysteine ligase
MWEHPATRANVATLRSRGVLVTDPASGRLTGADSGPGRLAEPDELLSLCTAVLEHPSITRDLDGRSVLVTAGATREALDPVRYLTNHSSGRQGWALARVAALRGADVTLVTGPTALAAPAGVTVVTVVSARDMHDAVMSRAARMDAVVMAAAVADHRPAEVSSTKLKKSAESPPPSVDLVANADILADVSASVGSATVVVGFAAETGDAESDVVALGRVKLAAKGCDLLVVNDVSRGRAFGAADNEAVILRRDGAETEVSRRSKEAVAATIWDEVVSLLPSTVCAT